MREVRRGVAAVLGTEPDLEVVGEAGTAAEALARVPALAPDVAVLDVRLPDGDGVTVCRELRSRVPGVHCLLLTSIAEEHALLAASPRRRGRVPAETDPRHRADRDDPRRRGRTVEPDQRLRTAAVERAVSALGTADPAARLSEQERTALALIVEGRTNREHRRADGAAGGGGARAGRPAARQARPAAIHRRHRRGRRPIRRRLTSPAPARSPAHPGAAARPRSATRRRRGCSPRSARRRAVRARSARLSRPLRRPSPRMPTPSSVTWMRSRSVAVTDTQRLLAWACRITLVTASPRTARACAETSGGTTASTESATRSVEVQPRVGRHDVEHGTDLLAQGLPLDSGLLQLEDRAPDVADGVVEVVHGVPQPRLQFGLLHLAADALQAHPGGEQPLDDLVVQVTGDALAVGQQGDVLPRPVRLVRLQRERRLPGEDHDEVGLVGGQRGRAGQLGDDEDTRLPGAAQRCERGGSVSLVLVEGGLEGLLRDDVGDRGRLPAPVDLPGDRAVDRRAEAAQADRVSRRRPRSRPAARPARWDPAAGPGRRRRW